MSWGQIGIGGGFDPFSQMGIGASPVDPFGAIDVASGMSADAGGFLSGLNFTPLNILGAAYTLNDLLTPNRSLYWGPQALTGAGAGAMTGLSLGGPIGAAVGAPLGYIGGKF